jgi:hypothetical protein
MSSPCHHLLNQAPKAGLSDRALQKLRNISAVKCLPKYVESFADRVQSGLQICFSMLQAEEMSRASKETPLSRFLQVKRDQGVQVFRRNIAEKLRLETQANRQR